MPKIELLANYGLSAKGDELDVSKPIADLLIGRKIAKIKGIKKQNDEKADKEKIQQ